MLKKCFLLVGLVLSFMFFKVGLIGASDELICKYTCDSSTDPELDFKFEVENSSVNFKGVFVNDKKWWISVKLDFDLKPKSYSDCPVNIYYNLSNGLGEALFYLKKPQGSQFFTCEMVEVKEYVKTKKVFCGDGKGKVTNIHKKIPELTSYIITIIQVSVPIILIILGSLDLFKGITAGKEDEIKKGQQMFVKRLVVAFIIFMIVVIVKFLISIIAEGNKTNIIDCIDCFISNKCEEDFSL